MKSPARHLIQWVPGKDYTIQLDGHYDTLYEEATALEERAETLAACHKVAADDNALRAAECAELTRERDDYLRLLEVTRGERDTAQDARDSAERDLQVCGRYLADIRVALDKAFAAPEMLATHVADLRERYEVAEREARLLHDKLTNSRKSMRRNEESLKRRTEVAEAGLEALRAAAHEAICSLGGDARLKLDSRIVARVEALRALLGALPHRHDWEKTGGAVSGDAVETFERCRSCGTEQTTEVPREANHPEIPNSSTCKEPLQIARPQRCPTCDSPSPEMHPAMQSGGEVQPCQDGWHKEAPKGAERPAVGAPVIGAAAKADMIAHPQALYGRKHIFGEYRMRGGLLEHGSEQGWRVSTLHDDCDQMTFYRLTDAVDAPRTPAAKTVAGAPAFTASHVRKLDALWWFLGAMKDNVPGDVGDFAAEALKMGEVL